MSTPIVGRLILWAMLPVILFSSKVEVFAAPASAPTTSTKSAAPRNSQRLVLWDGDTTSRDAGGWSGPNSAINTLQVTNTQAHGGKASLHWHGEGSGLIGAAWNFFNYQKAAKGPTGFDISCYRNLRLWLKVDAEAGKEPNGFSITLSSSANRRSSVVVNLDAAVKKALKGGWHEIVIPLQSLLPKAGDKTPVARRFDPKTVWEIGVSAWSQDERRFDVYIDDISVDAPMKTPANKSKPKPAKPKTKKPAATAVPNREFIKDIKE